MANAGLKKYLNINRFQDSISQDILLILYIPFGIILICLRLLIGLIVLFLGFSVPNIEIIRNFLQRLLCIVFGLSIVVENPEKKEEVDGYIGNQVSGFDPFIMHMVTGCITPGIKLNSTITSLLGIRHFGETTNFEQFKTNILEAITKSNTPLFFQPEAHTTNGKGLLKFNVWPFELCTKIQPVVIKIQRPLTNISATTIENNFWSDIFFYLFTPITVYNLKYLPAAEKKGCSAIEFCEKIRSDISTALKVKLIDYSAADVKEWKKRYIAEQQRIRVDHSINRSHAEFNPELNRMTLQVKEVLPLVPYNVIYRDLVKTRNVDVTITNILEGRITYTPESQVTTTASTSKSELSLSNSVSNCQGKLQDTLNTAASTFGKSAYERSSSFQERKQQLIENARRRYIEKHGLNNLVLNNC